MADLATKWKLRKWPIMCEKQAHAAKDMQQDSSAVSDQWLLGQVWSVVWKVSLLEVLTFF